MPIAPGGNRVRTALRRIAGEPFVHFVVLGAATFALHAALAPRDERRIEVTRSDIEHLRAASLKQWGRDPGPAQLDALLNAYIREEVLYREARAAGLDKDDVVIRRRLAQKMEFLAQSSVAEPSDEEMRLYQRAHVDRYSAPATVTFTQAYFGEERASKAAVAKVLALLEAGGQVQGKRFMLPAELKEQSAEDIARDFGTSFAQSVFSAPAGRWAGPFESAHGLHFVRVSGRTPAHALAFEEVRDRIRVDLANERIAAARDAAFEPLRSRYDVEIEPGATRIAAVR